MLKVMAIKCKKCGDVVYSRHRHDFRWCSCESCAIDGGMSYCRITGKPDDIEVIKDYSLPEGVTLGVLADDYLSGENKYGKIQVEGV